MIQRNLTWLLSFACFAALHSSDCAHASRPDTSPALSLSTSAWPSTPSLPCLADLASPQLPACTNHTKNSCCLLFKWWKKLAATAAKSCEGAAGGAPRSSRPPPPAAAASPRPQRSCRGIMSAANSLYVAKQLGGWAAVARSVKGRLDSPRFTLPLALPLPAQRSWPPLQAPSARQGGGAAGQESAMQRNSFDS